MSLSDLASLGSFVSGVAVLASLVILFFQMRQMTEQVKQSERNQQAQIRQSRADRTANLFLTRLEPSVALAVRKGFSAAEDISDVELEQYASYARAAFVSWQETFDQHRAGLIGAIEFADFTAGVQAVCAAPGMRIAWRSLRQVPLSRGFTTWLENLITEQPAVLPPDRLAEWKQAVAALRVRSAL